MSDGKTIVHDEHDLDEETVNRLTTNILLYTTGQKVCVHYLAEIACRLLASVALEQSQGDGPKAADVIEGMVKRHVAILRDPRTKIVMVAEDGKRPH